MDPREYIVPYVEKRYLEQHPDLTPAARELLHESALKNPDKYAVDEHSLALVAYARTREQLMRRMDQLEDLPDEEFEKQRNRLFEEARLALFKICETDPHCVDAQLLQVLLAETSLDTCLGDLMKLETRTCNYLKTQVEGFSMGAEHYWNLRLVAPVPPAGETPELFGSYGSTVPKGSDDAASAPAPAAPTAAELTRAEPAMIGWLHTLDALAQLSLASARYKAAIRYADMVLKAEGYPNQAAGTKLLALARLEDEDAFFKTARAYDSNSAWYLLGRALLLYKTGKMKPAQRALRDLVMQCDGAAFFLLNPTYLAPYVPDRPEPRQSWDQAHQAIFEADAIIMDTPDFPTWAESLPGVLDASEDFAARNGF